MTDKDKQLLLVDLCARLLYGVKVLVKDSNGREYNFKLDSAEIFLLEKVNTNIKPYLRPMSSMTEEEIKELLNIDKKRWIFSSRHLTWHLDGEVIDYLNMKMFDWRELIPKGLALEASEGMYNNKQ